MPRNHSKGNPPAVQAPEIYRQQIHRECGGRLVIGRSEAGKIAIFCTSCDNSWQFPTFVNIATPSDWESFGGCNG